MPTQDRDRSLASTRYERLVPLKAYAHEPVTWIVASTLPCTLREAPLRLRKTSLREALFSRFILQASFFPNLPFMAEITMPKLSDTMTDGTLVSWKKKQGEKVSMGEVIADVETDKATMEVEAFEDGILAEIIVQEGQKVAVGEKIALILAEGEAAPGPKAGKETQPVPVAEKEAARAGQALAPAAAAAPYRRSKERRRGKRQRTRESFTARQESGGCPRRGPRELERLRSWRKDRSEGRAGECARKRQHHNPATRSSTGCRQTGTLASNSEAGIHAGASARAGGSPARSADPRAADLHA